MILILAAATLAAGSPTAIDAERAFARDAQRIGQWAAFRRYAAPDAVMFTPQAVWARDFLKGRKEPARAVSWSPAASIMSCDRSVAVNGGPYASPGGEKGRFTTVWLKGKRGWKWIYDAVEPTAEPVPIAAVPMVRRASCAGRPPGAPIIAPPVALVASQGRVSPHDYGRGQSADRTLGWDWKVDEKGTRTLRVFQWTGRAYAQVLSQVVPAE